MISLLFIPIPNLSRFISDSLRYTIFEVFLLPKAIKVKSLLMDKIRENPFLFLREGDTCFETSLFTFQVESHVPCENTHGL